MSCSRTQRSDAGEARFRGITCVCVRLCVCACVRACAIFVFNVGVYPDKRSSTAYH